MKVGLNKSRSAVTWGLISLGLSGCVHHAHQEHTQQPFASAQSGLVQKTLFGFNLRSQNPALLNDPSQWPDKPNEIQSHSQFTELFPNLSERAENRQSVVLKEPQTLLAHQAPVPPVVTASPAAEPIPSSIEVAQTANPTSDTAFSPENAEAPNSVPVASVEAVRQPIAEPIPVQTLAAVPATADTPPVTAQTPAQTTPVEASNQGVAIQQPTVSPSPVTSIGLAAVSPEAVASLIQTAAAPIAVASPAQTTPPESTQHTTNDSVTIKAPTRTVQNEPTPPPAVTQPILSSPAIPDRPLTVENSGIQPIATPSASISSAKSDLKQVVEQPVADSGPIKHMSRPPVQAVVVAENLPPALPAEEVLHAATALDQTTSPVLPDSSVTSTESKPSLDVPGIPTESIPVATLTANEPPIIAVTENLEIPQTPAPTVAHEQVAMRDKPVPPAIPTVVNDPPVPAMIAKSPQAEFPKPVTIQIPAIPQAPAVAPESSVTPIQKSASATVPTPVIDTPGSTVSPSDPPPPGPAPEVEVPGIPAMSSPPPLLDTKATESATADKQIERSSAPMLNDKLAQEPQDAVAPGHSDKEGQSTEPGDQDQLTPAETPIPDIDRPSKTLTPLPDDASLSNLIQRTAEGDLVFRLKVTNPLRYWKPPVLVRSTRQPLKTQEPVESSAEHSRLQSLRFATAGFFRRDRRHQPEPVENMQVVASQKTEPETLTPPPLIEIEEPVQQQVTTQSTTPFHAIIKASAEMPVANTPATETVVKQPLRLSVNTSSELPPIEFPKSYQNSVRKSANPWANHARPAVNPYILQQEKITTEVAKKPENQSAAGTHQDAGVVPTSLTFSTRSTEPPKPAVEPASTAPKPMDQPATTQTHATGYQSRRFWWNSTGRLKALLNGADEIVPPAPKSLSQLQVNQDRNGKAPQFGPKFPIKNGLYESSNHPF